MGGLRCHKVDDEHNDDDDAHIIIVVKGVEDIVGQARKQVNEEPGLEINFGSNAIRFERLVKIIIGHHLKIIDADDFWVADHLTPRPHVGRVKVQDDVDEKYY